MAKGKSKRSKEKELVVEEAAEKDLSKAKEVDKEEEKAPNRAQEEEEDDDAESSSSGEIVSDIEVMLLTFF